MNRHWFIPALMLLFVMSLFTAQACGPDFYPDVFVRKLQPDNPVEFAAGKLGVLLPTYPRADLVVAFRYLNGGILDATEQKAYQPTYTVSDPLWERQQDAQQAESAKQVEPADQWKTARAKYAPTNPEIDKQAIADAKQSDGSIAENYFGNCLEDAFVRATATMESRAKTWGAKSAELADWLKGQDAVFSNCSNKTHTLPTSAPANASALLKADRAYQIAAAEFYSGNYEDARKSFAAIGKDAASPWQGLARYLEARCFIRQAFFSKPCTNCNKPIIDGNSMDTFDPVLMQQAVTLLESLLKSPPQGISTKAILDLRDLARLRSDPNTQLHLLATSLAGPKSDDRYNTHLQDLTWYLNAKLDGLPVREDASEYFFQSEVTQGNAVLGDAKKADAFSSTYRDLAPLRSSTLLIDWLITFQSPAQEAKAHAIAEWKKTHELYWLLAAITKTTEKDSEAVELVNAAEQIKPNSPAWESIEYHRLRLLVALDRVPEARTLLDQTLPQIKAGGRNSSISLYLGLRMKAASSLTEALTYAPRKIQLPSSESQAALDECVNVMQQNPKRVYDCKQEVNPLQFSEDAASFFNAQVPLATLVQSAQSDVLPEPLRRAVARMAWVRSVLLNDDASAAKLFPLLPEKLQQQAGAGTGFHPLMTLLRNPGLRPYLDAGVQRSYSYDFVESFRDNWWTTDWEDSFENKAPMPLQRASFLTVPQKADAARELSTLHMQGCASVSLGERTLAYVNQHPADSDAPESLYLVLRMIRYSRDDSNENDSPEVQMQAQEKMQAVKNSVARLLRQRYAASSWTKKAAPYVG